MNRRTFLKALAAAPLAQAGANQLARASDSVDFRPYIESDKIDELTPIDARGMDTFYPNVADYLWEDTKELYGKQFRLNCEWVDYYRMTKVMGTQFR